MFHLPSLESSKDVLGVGGATSSISIERHQKHTSKTHRTTVDLRVMHRELAPVKFSAALRAAL